MEPMRPEAESVPTPPDPQPGGELAAPITGTPVDAPAAVIPSAAEQRADAKGRVGNTVTQVGLPTSIVIIGTWIAALAHVDLDPGAGTDLPAQVTGAFVFVITWAMARWMNREGYNATDDHAAEVTDLRDRIAQLEQRLLAAA